jgi:hypothetical protein
MQVHNWYSTSTYEKAPLLSIMDVVLYRKVIRKAF